MKRVIKTEASAAMYNPVSQATVAANGMLYTAGMVGRSPESGEMLPSFAEQSHQALRNLGALLRSAGGGYQDVMFVQLYLLDMGAIEQFNEIFRKRPSCCRIPSTSCSPTSLRQGSTGASAGDAARPCWPAAIPLPVSCASAPA
jgi:2-iminobutanoate/2-iminopropanoate deaminase